MVQPSDFQPVTERWQAFKLLVLFSALQRATLNPALVEYLFKKGLKELGHSIDAFLMDAFKLNLVAHARTPSPVIAIGNH